MALRMVELVVRRDDSISVSALSEQVRALGIWRDTMDDDLMLLRVLVPHDRTDTVISKFEEHFRADEAFRLVVFEVVATVPEIDLNDEESQNGDDAEEKDPKRVACAELVQTLSGNVSINHLFIITVLLSTVVATIGLIRDNVAVIIGAMVIAPLLGPNMTLSVATTLGDVKLGRRAFMVNVVGFALVLAMSVAMGFAVDFDPHSHEIATRTSLSGSDIALALAAGTAGALAFTTGVSASLVGVMVAVALLPPLAVTGLMLGAGNWQLARGAFMLVSANVICINLAGVATFLFQGVRPRHWWKAERARRMVILAAVIWTTLLACLLLILYLVRSGDV